jgi:hypothetical protein
MTEPQGTGINSKWLGVVAVLFGILLLANHGNEFLKQSVLTPGSAAELGVAADCRPDELEEEGLSLQECELMVSNVQIALVSSPAWFRSTMQWLSVFGILFATYSITSGIAFVGERKTNRTLVVLCFGGLVLLDLFIFVAAVNTGPLLRAQYLWSTLLWFFIHLSLLAAVLSAPSRSEEESS